MNAMPFDMRRIGAAIARIRKERNMTQLQLADEMGVSYQAVSNWERGQTMPDIAKLPELAALFDMSIDQLLGRSAPLIEQAAQGSLQEYVTENPVTVAELAEAAPILMPRQVEQAAEKLSDVTKVLNLNDLLPYLSENKVDDMLRRAAQAGKPVESFLPFASERTIDQVAAAIAQQGQPMDQMLPFMSERAVDEMAVMLMQQGQPMREFLLPFMSERAVDEMAHTLASNGQDFTMLLPHMSESGVNRIALERIRSGQSIQMLMPFIGEDLLDELADSLET